MTGVQTCALPICVPNGSGKIGIDAVVGQTGAVQKSTIRASTISDDQFKSCVAGQVKTWKFPRPRGGEPVTVSFPPFVFAPK